jgi:hypothetical protein
MMGKEVCLRYSNSPFCQRILPPKGSHGVSDLHKRKKREGRQIDGRW